MDYVYAFVQLLSGLGAFLIGFKILSENIEKLANSGLKKLFNKLKTDFKDIDVTRDYIEIQEQYISSVKANSILNSNPELCKEWNYKKNLNISPNNVTSGSKKKVWWVCPKCGYEWQVQIVNRNHGTNCPKCRKKDG